MCFNILVFRKILIRILDKKGHIHSFTRASDGASLTLNAPEVAEVMTALNDVDHFGMSQRNFSDNLNAKALKSKSPNVSAFLLSAATALDKKDGTKALNAQRVGLSSTGVKSVCAVA